LTFYQDVLGGRGQWMYGEPPGFGGIRLGQEQLLFELQPQLAERAQGVSHLLFAEAIDTLHAQHVAAGAPIIDPIGNKPWGYREYVVRDPNGYRLRFAGSTSYEKPPTARDTMPDDVRIELRKPSREEYCELHRSVGWNDTADVPDVLEHSWAGAVAIDIRNKQVLAMVRVMNDAHAWYSVWDVVVRPEYQSQRIGTALVEAVLDHLRATAPAGSKVYLFTYSHAFYARVGFEQKPCTMITL